ncbi:MAG: peptide/nickel transport system permease protein [Thermomicrobiales bacterium]|jgi:peptide/nickel transport system permease protein|nr:peptide/nickel transport system permease protein [Thermomicrobiales bacterium]MEA2525574.1 peptide/nickel transport system permease protein [Thermomicrobiales bacterium]
MLGYVFRRVLLMVPTLLGVSLILFALLHLAPGGPEGMLIGDQYNPELAARVRHNLKLDRSVPEQYVAWLGSLLRGDLGRSFFDGSPVTTIIGERVMATVQLALAGFVLAAVIGISLGVLAALRHNSIVDRLATAVALVGVSFPSFWLGILLILAFSVRLGWLPSSGISTYGEEGDLGSRLRHLLLPAITLSAVQLAIYMRFTRAAMLEVLNQDYIRTAEAKGLRQRVVVVRHGLRNALLPLLTIAGFSLKSLIGGAVFIEVVFAWPGLGRLAVDSVYARDYPVVLGLNMLIAVVTICSNLLIDVLYGIADPRIRFGQ